MDEPVELTLRKWRHRRFMAYTALWGALAIVGIIMILAAIGAAGELSDFVALLITALGGLFSIVGAYFGFSTWYDRR